ncbi:MAG: sterol desaturase family protein [bacterium]
MFDKWISQNANDLQVVLFFTLLFLFSLAEVFGPKRPGPMHRKERWLTNYLMTALNIVVMGMLPVTFFGVAVWAQAQGYGLFNAFSTPIPALVIGTLLVRGFISFFTHYLMHKVPMLWRLHRVHHLDTELDVSTTVRFHPLEFLAALPLGVPVVVIFGLSPWVLLLYEVFDAGVTLFSHANIRLPAGLDRALRYVIVTPDLHRVHHSSWQPETDSNYSAVFPIWDILFGTFRTDTRAPHETMELGLEEVRDRRANRFLWLLGSPFRGQLRAQPAKAVAGHRDSEVRQGGGAWK